MSAVVNVYEAKTQLSMLLTRVEQGEEIVIARNGRPVARIVPLALRPDRTPGLFSGQIEMAADFDDFSDADAADWYGA